MRPPMRIAAVTLIVGSAIGMSHANESIIQYAGIQKAQRLSGVIRDSAGAAIPQVVVQEMSSDWTKVLQETETDAGGHWALPALRERKVHNVRFLKYGFHQIRFRVRLKSGARKPLDFKMPPS